MAHVIVTLKIMPESPDVDLESVYGQVDEKVTAFAGKGIARKEVEPVAFGLKALKITFSYDENKGDTEGLEADITSVTGVQSVEVASFSRALG